jgi:hypothetical protein
MPTCPSCDRSTARWLEAASRNAHVDYFRCDDCGHVWCVSKEQPAAAPHTVAEGRKTGGETH